MKHFLSLLLLALTALVLAAPHAEARNRRPRIVKTIDISDDPEVRAAEKRHIEAERALREARDKNDKNAIAALEAEKKAAEEAVARTRREALAKAKSGKR